VVPRISVMLVRSLVHGALHVGPNLRVFAQLGSHLSVGDPMRRLPPDEDVLDIQQAFVEARAELDGTVLTTRVGRQEMALGRTARWVSLRDGLTLASGLEYAGHALVETGTFARSSYCSTRASSADPR
jgi:hypothetical protein